MDAAGEAASRPARGHTRRVWSLAFAVDGQRLTRLGEEDATAAGSEGGKNRQQVSAHWSQALRPARGGWASETASTGRRAGAVPGCRWAERRPREWSAASRPGPAAARMYGVAGSRERAGARPGAAIRVPDAHRRPDPVFPIFRNRSFARSNTIKLCVWLCLSPWLLPRMEAQATSARSLWRSARP